jgi:hypothetical protein
MTTLGATGTGGDTPGRVGKAVPLRTDDRHWPGLLASPGGPGVPAGPAARRVDHRALYGEAAANGNGGCDPGDSAPTQAVVSARGRPGVGAGELGAEKETKGGCGGCGVQEVVPTRGDGAGGAHGDCAATKPPGPDIAVAAVTRRRWASADVAAASLLCPGKVGGFDVGITKGCVVCTRGKS